MNTPKRLLSPKDLLQELTKASVVRVRGGQGGTGFFVTPTAILTCAHVVATDRVVTARTVSVVTSNGARLTGEVDARPQEWTGGKVWPYPDLCLIRLADLPEYRHHQPVLLGETPDEIEVYLIGFGNPYDDSKPRTIGGGRIAGSADLVGGTALGIVDCDMPAGLSGAPVVDTRHGVVCGVAKSTRRPEADMGGLAIPAMAIRAEFPDVWDWNQQAAGSSGQWPVLRDALRDGESPDYPVLTNSEWKALADAVERFSYQGKQLTLVWREVVDSLAGDKSFNTLPALVDDLSVRLSQNGLDPLIKLFEVFASRTDGPLESDLRKHASDLAVRNEQTPALDEYRSRQVPRERPVIVIRIEPSCEPGEVKLQAWAYDYWEAPKRPVNTALERGPHPIAKVEETILQVLHRVVQAWAPPTIVQLALPDEMLDDAVEGWMLHGFPMGIRHPVVVRFGEWPDDEPDENGPDPTQASSGAEALMRSWKGRFSSLTTPPSWRAWTRHWVDCANLRNASQLYGMLNSPGRPPFIAMTSWPGGDPVPVPVQLARAAGAPVIVWRHSACLMRNPAGCTGTAGTCPGSMFRQHVIDALSNTTFDRLPEKVRSIRAEAAERSDPELGLGIAMLWEDPDHVPWADPPPVQAAQAGLSRWLLAKGQQ